MNTRDENAFVQSVKAIVDGNAASPVIAIDASTVMGVLKNVRRTSRSALNAVLEDMNDILSATSVCKELGGIYTLCEYEANVLFLIRADLATSATSLFVPSEKVMR